MNKRNSNIELVRVTAMILVLVIHTLQPAEDDDLLRTILETFLWTSNFMFLMISGELNLQKRMDSSAQMLQFYLRRAVTILLPLLLTTTMMYAVDVIRHGQNLSLGGAYAAFVVSYSNTHLWFVYTLTGLILSTPILSKAFRHMSDGELHVLFAVGLLWPAAQYYLAEDLGINFGFNYWLLESYAMYYFVGYYLRRTLNQRGKRWLYGAGAACFFVTVLAAYRFYDYYGGSFDDAPTYILFVMAVYTFLSREVNVKGLLEKAVLFLGRHSFTIYLIHWTMLFELVSPLVPDMDSRFLFFLSRFSLNAVLCVIAAVVIDHFFLFPLQNKLNSLINAKILKSNVTR